MVHFVLQASLVLAALSVSSAASKTYLKFTTSPMTQATCDMWKTAKGSKTGVVTDNLICTTDTASFLVLNPKSLAGPGVTQPVKTGTEWAFKMDFKQSDEFSFRVVSHSDQVINLVNSWNRVVLGATFWAKPANNVGVDLKATTPVMAPTTAPAGIRIWGEPAGDPTMMASQNSPLKVTYNTTTKNSKMWFEIDLAQQTGNKGKNSSFSEVTAPWAFPPNANSGPINWSIMENSAFIRIERPAGGFGGALATPEQRGCNAGTNGANTVPAMACLAKSMQERLWVPPTAANLCNIHRGIVGCYVNNSCVGEELVYCTRADVMPCKLSICPQH